MRGVVNVFLFREVYVKGSRGFTWSVESLGSMVLGSEFFVQGKSVSSSSIIFYLIVKPCMPN